MKCGITIWNKILWRCCAWKISRYVNEKSNAIICSFVYWRKVKKGIIELNAKMMMILVDGKDQTKGNGYGKLSIVHMIHLCTLEWANDVCCNFREEVEACSPTISQKGCVCVFWQTRSIFTPVCVFLFISCLQGCTFAPPTTTCRRCIWISEKAASHSENGKSWTYYKCVAESVVIVELKYSFLRDEEMNVFW